MKDLELKDMFESLPVTLLETAKGLHVFVEQVAEHHVPKGLHRGRIYDIENYLKRGFERLIDQHYPFGEYGIGYPSKNKLVVAFTKNKYHLGTVYSEEVFDFSPTWDDIYAEFDRSRKQIHGYIDRKAKLYRLGKMTLSKSLEYHGVPLHEKDLADAITDKVYCKDDNGENYLHNPDLPKGNS